MSEVPPEVELNTLYGQLTEVNKVIEELKADLISEMRSARSIKAEIDRIETQLMEG